MYSPRSDGGFNWSIGIDEPDFEVEVDLHLTRRGFWDDVESDGTLLLRWNVLLALLGDREDGRVRDDVEDL